MSQTTLVNSDLAIEDNFAPYEAQPGESYMNDRQKEYFFALLLHVKKKLWINNQNTLSRLQDEAVVSSDISDQASQEEAFRIKLRTHGREFLLTKKVDEAVRRLTTTDSYGYCETCNGEIGIRRLEARPTATLCIDCKTLAEIREKQQGN